VEKKKIWTAKELQAMWSSDPRGNRITPPRRSEQEVDVITAKGLRGAYYLKKDRYSHKGGYSDVFKTELIYRDGTQQTVAVKDLKALQSGGSDPDMEKMTQRLKREADIWFDLKHPNIAPLLGFRPDPQSPSLVSPWYEKGSMNKYLPKNDSCNRLKLLHEVALGLAYLHGLNPPIVHGDIKPDNVLITNADTAVIIDFGLSHFAREENMSSSKNNGVTEWMAPETLTSASVDDDGDAGEKTLNSDVWSFGCLVFWTMTNEKPYHEIKNVHTIVLSMMKGRLPASKNRKQYSQLEEGSPVWEVLDKCWDFEPDRRPSIQEVTDDIASIQALL